MKQIQTLVRVQPSRKVANKLPDIPGVYIFWKENSPIYIGKAKSLKNRVGSYFSQNLAAKTAAMVADSDGLSFIKVDSELESLLLEANLIRKNQPRYNSVSKDDKHPLYIVITEDKYPRVISCRKPKADSYKLAYGPFPSSGNVYSVLKMLRRIFPFSDHKLGKRGCLYSHIGLCKPCPSEIERITNQESRIRERRKYLKNISRAKSILSGKLGRVRKALEKEMKAFAKDEKYEEAAKARRQIERLDYITQPIIPAEYFLENPNLREDIRTEELKNLKTFLASYFPSLNSLTRIECFDVSHLGGTNPTASMVTFINGEPDKSLYRHFRIRQKGGQDDIASMKEVIKRRSSHWRSWGKPDLIIVDGGKGQVSVFKEVFDKNKIPVVGVAKSFETLIIPRFGTYEVRNLSGHSLKLVQRLRDEAHRFARVYHHRLVKRELIGYNG